MRAALALSVVVLAGCGRLGFAPAELDAPGGDAPGFDVPPGVVKVISASGVWADTASELRRTLVTQVSDRRLTFSTWYRSSAEGQMLLCAGVSDSEQSFVWAGVKGGQLYFQHTGAYAGGPDYGGQWPWKDTWVHVVVAVDTTDLVAGRRIRWWINGVEQAISDGQAALPPQDLGLYLGTPVIHSLGNKWTGGFDWFGSLAETYLIFGHALDPSAFVVSVAPGVVRSIAYAGPVTPESVYFEYRAADLGANSFGGEPGWNATMMTASSDVPY